MSDWTKTWTTFTVVLPQHTLSIASALKTTDRSSPSQDDLENGKHWFLFGFNCKQLTNSEEGTLENYINSAIAAYYASRDLHSANIEGLNLATVLLESESRFPITRGVALYSTDAHAWHSQFLLDDKKAVIEDIFRKYSIDTVFKTDLSSKKDETSCSSRDHWKMFRFKDVSQIQPVESDGERIRFQKCDSNSSSLTSPIFANDLYCPVFHNLLRARSVLEKV
jgi:hypothetical protein